MDPSMKEKHWFRRSWRTIVEDNGDVHLKMPQWRKALFSVAFSRFTLYSRDSLTASPETERRPEDALRGEAKLRENTIAKARLCAWEMWEIEKMSRSRGFSWDRA